MPAVVPLPPTAIKELLEEAGYEVVATDRYNWAFAKGESDEPVMVPREIDLVPLDVAFNVARRVGFTNYFAKFADMDRPSLGGPVH